jgi:ribosomal protein S18 acetylase RimI-like enzyme
MNLAGYRVRRATTADAPAIQALFELDPAYFELVDQAPLRPIEALETLADRPPVVPPEHKHDFLIEAPDAATAPAPPTPPAPLVALLSMVESYPDERTWFLGLIFVAPSARGTGLGTRAIEALCAHIRGRGGAALRLGVVPGNTGAYRLYERLGFTFVVRRTRPNWNGTTTEVDVLERPV